MSEILNGKISYSDLRQIIFDYYKENKGIQLSSISIDYLPGKLMGNNDPRPFFVINNEFGESRFDISNEDIQKIFSSYLASKNYKLTELNYGSMVEFKYRLGKKQEKGEQKFLQPANTNPQDELARMAREKRKFTILQRERAMSDAQRAKNRSAIMAGICILGAAVACYFNGQDVNQVLQHELNAIYSWEALGQYLQDLGPLTTLLSAGAGGFIGRYFRNSRKLKQAQNEFIDFNNSLENEQTLGGNEDAKSK